MDQERGYRTEGQESEGGVSNLVYTGNCREGFVRGLLVTRGVYIQWIRVEDWQEELLSLEFLGLESDGGGNSEVLEVGRMKAMSVSLMVKYKIYKERPGVEGVIFPPGVEVQSSWAGSTQVKIHKKKRRATGKLKKIPVKWKVRTKNMGKVSSEVCETSREKFNMDTKYSYSQVNTLLLLLPLLGMVNQGKWGGKVYNKLEVLVLGKNIVEVVRKLMAAMDNTKSMELSRMVLRREEQEVGCVSLLVLLSEAPQEATGGCNTTKWLRVSGLETIGFGGYNTSWKGSL